jgi:hypothetical protein
MVAKRRHLYYIGDENPTKRATFNQNCDVGNFSTQLVLPNFREGIIFQGTASVSERGYTRRAGPALNITLQKIQHETKQLQFQQF